MDLGAVDVVGRGNLDAASRGIPLAGRVVVLGWPSIFDVLAVLKLGVQGGQAVGKKAGTLNA
jgi:hypothetical protein